MKQISIQSRGTLEGHRAFTLIELLVVIAVIAILAALLLPSLTRAKISSQTADCLNNHKQLSVAWIMYANDNNGLLVANPDGGALYTYNSPGVLSSFGWDPGFAWAFGWMQASGWTSGTNPVNITSGGLFPYTKNIKIYRCPSDSTSTARLRSYSMSCRMSGVSPGFPTDFDPGYPFNMKDTDIQHPPPAKAFVFIDESPVTLQGCVFWVGVPDREWADFPAMWHGNGDNLSFADGHAEHWQWLETNTLNPRLYFPLPAMSPVDRDFDRIANATESD